MLCRYFLSSPHSIFVFIKMDEAPVTRSTLNVNSQQKSKAKNKIKNTLNSNELSSIEQRKKYQKHLKKHKNTAEDISGKGIILYSINTGRLLKIQVKVKFC